jgi:hypothetical protein
MSQEKISTSLSRNLSSICYDTDRDFIYKKKVRIQAWSAHGACSLKWQGIAYDRLNLNLTIRLSLELPPLCKTHELIYPKRAMPHFINSGIRA